MTGKREEKIQNPWVTNYKGRPKIFEPTVETDPCVSHVATVRSEGRESTSRASLIMRGSDLSAEVVAMSQGEDALFLALDSDCQKKLTVKPGTV